MRSLLYALTVLSLPMRGAWIEMREALAGLIRIASLPMRGAWIEIQLPAGVGRERKSLPMRGAWIEIQIFAMKDRQIGRSPCGERGLKYQSWQSPRQF